MANVLLVTVDSLRSDHVGCFGYDRDTTPVIDDIAADGLSFRGFANSHWTRASFSSIITSTYPLEYGGYEYLSDERTTVGEAISQAGHTTGAFHSNLWLSRDYNYDRGFDRFYDSKSDPTLLARLRTALKLRLNHDSIVYRTLQWLYDTTEERAGVDVGQTYKDGETITDEAISWLETVDEPFFAWIHYMDVHHPYVPHESSNEALDLDVDLTEREAIQLRRRMVEEPESLTDDEWDTVIDLYDGEIRYTDSQIGRLLDTVEDSFGMEDTAVVVASDHGEEFLEHGSVSHNHGMYDEVLSVPIVVNGADRVSGVDARGHQEEIVELLDVAPTCCDLAGAPIPDTYRGRSLLDVPGSGDDARVISETFRETDSKHAVRTREWKYIWNRQTGETELYDLQADPAEQHDVVDEHPDVASEFREVLTDHLATLQETNQDLPDVEMDRETEERLKNLGYLE